MKRSRSSSPENDEQQKEISNKAPEIKSTSNDAIVEFSKVQTEEKKASSDSPPKKKKPKVTCDKLEP